jgi:hypothetical protein
MTMALHVTSNDRAVENVECGEQGRGAVAPVIVRHGAEPDLVQRQARLGAVEGLDLSYEPIEVRSGSGKGGVRAREHWMAHG